MMTKRTKLTMRKKQWNTHKSKTNTVRIARCSLRVAVWIEKHAVDKISVITGCAVAQALC